MRTLKTTLDTAARASLDRAIARSAAQDMERHARRLVAESRLARLLMEGYDLRGDDDDRLLTASPRFAL